MSNPTLPTIAAIGALALVLSACAATPTPPSRTPTPTPTAQASVSFDDGADLPPSTDISWGDGFASDDEWEEVESLAAPGRWAYLNADQNCIASFRGGVLGDADGKNDQEASDALIEVETGESVVDLGEAVSDAEFLRYEPGGGRVAGRQFSLTVDGRGRFIATRAFVALDYSVTVSILCQGGDVNAIAGEVLSKNMISVDTDAAR